ncbi:GXGXG motif-containing protein [Desulfotomaculum arcticum]|uniref:GXGXG motif-containing protein n=1 Tax=Desulfotruncus arcticus DSM 17038 TaxID=1121424 RepID=A0A1I2RJJ1_9FIRM|nr:tributyrin esterase [Desulfotruncus arcticus]SFG40854.1 GXGXG motif-containing protein [Desulfotomaculum arcticum] [Desulfotruncus arcticus DSM 17038]
MINLDADKLSVTEINRALREAAQAGEEVEVLNPRARHHLGVGILRALQMTVRGSAGYFCGCLNENVKLRVEGSVGWFAADNMMSGEFIVERNAGSCAAPGMRGGNLVVKGNMGSRPGQVMKGGTIIVGQNSGFMTGFMMINGTIVVLGNAGDLVGHYMVGGTIYAGGQVESLGVDVQEAVYTAEDDCYLSELLHCYGLEKPPAFRKFVSAQKHHRYGKRVYEGE